MRFPKFTAGVKTETRFSVGALLCWVAAGGLSHALGADRVRGSRSINKWRKMFSAPVGPVRPPFRCCIAPISGCARRRAAGRRGARVACPGASHWRPRSPLALAEMSYVAGKSCGTTSSHGKPRGYCDYYLSARFTRPFPVWRGALPSRTRSITRYRAACDLYTWAGSGVGRSGRYQRGRAFGKWAPPFARGEIELHFSSPDFPPPLDQFDQFLAADKFRVRGISVRNRASGMGTPLIAVRKLDPELRYQGAVPATVFLRVTNTLAEVASDRPPPRWNYIIPSTRPRSRWGGLRRWKRTSPLRVLPS